MISYYFVLKILQNFLTANSLHLRHRPKKQKRNLNLKKKKLKVSKRKKKPNKLRQDAKVEREGQVKGMRNLDLNPTFKHAVAL
jgi:hypothetical protein